MSFFFFPFFPFLVFKCWGIISAWLKHKTEHNPVINQSTFYTAAFLERQLKDLSLQFQTNILWHALEIELIIIKRGTLSVRGGSWKRDVLVNSVLNKLSWVLLDRKIMRERRKVIKNAASLISPMKTSGPRVHRSKQETEIKWKHGRMTNEHTDKFILYICLQSLTTLCLTWANESLKSQLLPQSDTSSWMLSICGNLQN